jgi:ribose-phosphate pyrophosphokinase
MLENSEVMYIRNEVLNHLNIGSYPDTTPMVKSNATGVDTIILRPGSFQTFVATMFWVDSLYERGNGEIELILPCLPGARQDRINASGDVLFTAKSIARMINDRQFSRVTTLDPHSDVMPGLIDRCEVIGTYDIFAKSHYLEGWTGVIAPDAGAAKRAEKVAKHLRRPLYQAWKRRDVSNGKITGFGCEPIQGAGNYLVVDDLCDAGGTFIGLAEFLKVSYLDLYVTHGLFTKGFSRLYEHYNHIFTTDSIADVYNRSSKLDYVSVLPAVELLIDKKLGY